MNTVTVKTKQREEEVEEEKVMKDGGRENRGIRCPLMGGGKDD